MLKEKFAKYKMQIKDLLVSGELSECLVCYEKSNFHSKCCNVSICLDCYEKWLQVKRQCSHCNADQCDFDLWVEKFRVESELDLEEYYNELMGVTQVDLAQTQGMLQQFFQNIMAGTIQADQLLSQIDPLPEDSENYDLQIGFTVNNGNGPPLTVTQNIYTDGNLNENLDEIYDQLTQMIDNLTNPNNEGSPPN